MPELSDWLNSINVSKTNLIDDDPLLEPKYLPYIVNRCLSGHIDSLMYANEMNINHSLDYKLQYDFLLNSLRSKKRYASWMKASKSKNLEYVKEYYNYSNEKAKSVLNILNDEQIATIKEKLKKGGKK